MTDKRFINDIDNGKLIDTKGELSTIYYSDSVDFFELWEFLNKLNDENEQLKFQLQNTSYQRDEFYRGARENANRVGKLKKENERLKQEYHKLKHRHSLIHDVCLDAECERDSLKKDINSLEEENEQLKQKLRIYRKIVNCQKDDDEFEVYEKESNVTDGICKE